MALTEEQIAQRMNQVDMAIIGLLEQYFEARKDDPATPQDESKLDWRERMQLAGHMTMVLAPALYDVIEDLDGTARAELLNAYKNRGKM